MEKISEELYMDQKLPVKKAYLKAKQLSKKLRNGAHATLRLVVTGVYYPHETNKPQVVHEVFKNANV